MSEEEEEYEYEIVIEEDEDNCCNETKDEEVIIIKDEEELLINETKDEEDDYLSNSKYKMQIIIDCREKSLIKSCQELISKNKKFNNILLKTKNLEIADIIISDMNNIQHLLIERKTIQDLVSSIKDGRYKEQSFRLTHSEHPNHNIIYLIEGDVNRFNAFKERIDKQTLYSAIFSI